MSKNNDHHDDHGEDINKALPDYVLRLRKEYAKPKFEDEEAISPTWLITFTDIMALMLTFFVLLYSMAQPDVKKWEDITGAMNKQFSEFFAPQFNAGTVDEITIDKVGFRSALNLDYLTGLLKEALKGSEDAKGILFLPQRDVLILSMPEDLLFDAGKAEVSTDGKRVLFTLGGVLSHIKNAIEVVGHADPRPIGDQNQNFKSNWDLSLIRAVNVSDILHDVGYDRDIVTRGAASGRYDDLPDDLPELTRMGLSRRVDIVILKNDGSLRTMLGDM